MSITKNEFPIGGLFRNYHEYLNHWLWFEKRDCFLSIKPLCEVCNRKSVLVHHKTYENIGNESQRDLMALCWNCHTNIHKKDDRYNNTEGTPS